MCARRGGELRLHALCPGSGLLTNPGLLYFFLMFPQMARHVFQYPRWHPPLGLFMQDPTRLPPLEALVDRPAVSPDSLS